MDEDDPPVTGKIARLTDDGKPATNLRVSPDARRAGERDDDSMLFTASSTPVASLIAGLLMVYAGLGKKRLGWRRAECPVCHHPLKSCTCRSL